MGLLPVTTAKVYVVDGVVGSFGPLKEDIAFAVNEWEANKKEKK